MTVTAQANFPRLKSAGVQGAKVVGREQLVRIDADKNGHVLTKGGVSGERTEVHVRTKNGQEKTLRGK